MAFKMNYNKGKGFPFKDDKKIKTEEKNLRETDELPVDDSNSGGGPIKVHGAGAPIAEDSGLVQYAMPTKSSPIT